MCRRRPAWPRHRHDGDRERLARMPREAERLAADIHRPQRQVVRHGSSPPATSTTSPKLGTSGQRLRQHTAGVRVNLAWQRHPHPGPWHRSRSARHRCMPRRTATTTVNVGGRGIFGVSSAAASSAIRPATACNANAARSTSAHRRDRLVRRHPVRAGVEVVDVVPQGVEGGLVLKHPNPGAVSPMPRRPCRRRAWVARRTGQRRPATPSTSVTNTSRRVRRAAFGGVQDDRVDLFGRQQRFLGGGEEPVHVLAR